VLILMLYFVFVTWGYLVGFGVDNVGQISFDIPFPVTTVAQRVWGGAWVLLLFALLNSAIAVSIACFNGGTRTWYGMGRSGVLPSALGKVTPSRRTPDNAIHLQVAVNVVAFVLVLIFGAEDTFFSWANMITLGLISMYLLANIGVAKYYLTEARDQFNPLLHIVVPAIASAAGLVVVWKSYFSPFQSTGPVYWGLMLYIVLVVITVLALVFLRVRGREDWLRKAQLVFEESGGGH
jgi:amino acid transporter